MKMNLNSVMVNEYINNYAEPPLDQQWRSYVLFGSTKNELLISAILRLWV